jgi:hypothetical protein
MAKQILNLASIILLLGMVAYAHKVFKFANTGETFFNSTQGTIHASFKIINNGKVNICDYEKSNGQFLGMYEDTAANESFL